MSVFEDKELSILFAELSLILSSFPDLNLGICFSETFTASPVLGFLPTLSFLF
jgi:hypothetical protein